MKAQTVSLVALIVMLLAGAAGAYEFRTHHGITAAARAFLYKNRESYGFDDDFVRLIAGPHADEHGFGDLIDSRAGDPYEDAWLDEDHEEGRLVKTLLGCYYEEGPCAFSAAVDHLTDGGPCTLDHFRVPLRPLPGEPAEKHARYYLDMAYRLYVAGKCAEKNKDDYFKAAAKALGHALHLVEDMGSPQHVRPENHA